jgi:hypothetical protein
LNMITAFSEVRQLQISCRPCENPAREDSGAA